MNTKRFLIEEPLFVFHNADYSRKNDTSIYHIIMKRKFIYMRAAPSGEIRNAWILMLGSSIPDVKRSRALYNLSETLGDYFSLYNREAAEMVSRSQVRPQITTFQTLTKFQLL